MSLWKDLLGTDVGLASFGVILGVLVIGAAIALIIRGKMNESPRR